MNSLSDLKSFTNPLPLQEKLMPVLFVGHGSPMNGIAYHDIGAIWLVVIKTIQ
jgi:4,5-DOPA dioxygenase extradiol